MNRPIPKNELVEFGGEGSAMRDWLGSRMAFWPQGIPDGRRIGLVSSRLGNAPESRSTWFTALRTICAKASAGDLLVSVAETAADPFVQRCAELFDFRLLRIHLPKPKLDFDDWRPSELNPTASPRTIDVFVSPEIESSSDDTPLRDRISFVISDQLYALHVRPSGSIQHLIERRLADTRFPIATTFVALGPDIISAKLAEQLMNQGAVGYHVFGGQNEERDFFESPFVAPQIPPPSPREWPFLTHCTRRRVGMWPDQNEQEYLDDLILSRPAADHSPFSALTRIVEQRLLVSSGEAIRGGTSVVCFTAVPLSNLADLRTFRSHRARWDFEPYGICIRRDWLEQNDAHPVQYLEHDDWETLCDAERPFFQMRLSQTPSGNMIDWTVEQEWRVVGDLNLSELPPDGAIVFVKTQQEADQISRISPWPVCLATGEAHQ